MKLITITLLTIIFSTFLNAEYLRTIRLGSFSSEKRAELQFLKLQKFVQKHKNITELQKVWDFDFNYRKSGSYYVILAEPLRDKAVLQDVLDTLRKAYPDAYVTRLESAPPFEKKIAQEEIVEPKTQEQVQEVAVDELASVEAEVIVEEEPEVVETVEVEETVIAEPEPKIEPVATKKIEKKIEKKVEPTKYSYIEEEKKEESFTQKEEQVQMNLYKPLFFIALFLLFISGILLYRYKKKDVNCADREMEANELFSKKEIEIRHKDSFLTHAKTSVATIHNFTNLLLEFDLTQIQKDYVQRIRSSSEHLLNTVNNTLDITKLKNNTLKIENNEFDLNEMLRKVSKIISLEAKNNDTEFELNVEDDVPAFIFGDETRIRQVLINLLGNSVKFTEGGNISLTIKTLYNYTNAITLSFIIKDSGVGMNSEQVEDILDSSVEIVEGGTVGLGLSVTKQLIEIMHGEIKIYSTEDVGTTFTFTLKFSVTR